MVVGGAPSAPAAGPAAAAAARRGPGGRSMRGGRPQCVIRANPVSGLYGPSAGNFRFPYLRDTHPISAPSGRPPNRAPGAGREAITRRSEVSRAAAGATFLPCGTAR